jgi:glucokinase
VDIGGTNIVVGAIGEDGGEIAGIEHRPTPVADGPDAVVARTVMMIKESLKRAKQTYGTVDVIGIGIGCPGPIDTARGVVVVSPNLGWKDMPLRDRIIEEFKLPATLENDASCAILGEWWHGAAKGTSILVGFTIGTGVGGGIVLNGEIFHGACDVAGEFGHTTIDSTGRRCVCGNYGCLEAYASGPAIAARAIEGVEAGIPTSLPGYVDGGLESITAQTVYQAAKDGDSFARQVVYETARFLGAGVANVVNIFNPEMVVVCGGVTAAGDGFFQPLQQEVKRRAFRPAADVCKIVPGTLPGTAGVYGAAAVFRNRGLPR